MPTNNANILREFLVAIGFDIDEGSYKNFEGKLKGTIEKFAELTKIAAAAGVALAVTVGKTADELEKLYFSSERAGTSVANLLGLRLGGAQAGVGADKIAGLVEGMASTLRSNPGLMMFMRQLNVPISTDGTKNFENLVNSLRQLDQRGGGVLARIIGQQFGIDEQTLNLLFKNWPDYIAGRREEERILKDSGLDAEKLAERSHRFQVEWRTFLAHAEVLGFLLADHILPVMDRLVVFLTRAIEAMVRLDHATKGWSTTIGGIVAALGGVVASMKILGAVGGFLGIGGGGGAAAATGTAAAGGGAATAIAGSVGTVLSIMGLAIADVGLLAFDVIQGKKLLQAYGGTAGISGNIKGFIAHMEGLRLRAYADHGQSIGYGHHILPGENFGGGITAGQANQLLDADTAKAADAVRRLVTVPINQNMLDALIDFVYNLGSGKLAHSDLLKKLNSGDYAGAAEQFQNFNKERIDGKYVTNADLTARRLGEKNLFLRPTVNMNQKTDIHITGSGDPNKAGLAVSKEQTRVNGDMVRNLAGVGAPQ